MSENKSLSDFLRVRLIVLKDHGRDFSIFVRDSFMKDTNFSINPSLFLITRLLRLRWAF